MLLKSDRIELPERVEPISTRLAVYPHASTQFNGYTIATLLDYQVLKSKPFPKRGQPMFYAFTDTAKTTVMHVRPEPDKPYRAQFRYCTPYKEI